MPQSAFRNHVLKSLSPADFALVQPSLHHVVLGDKAQLATANASIKNVYFPEAGVASVVATAAGGGQSAVGFIGREGMSGLALVLGQDSSPEQTIVQIAGSGWCLSGPMLRAALADSSTLRDTLLRYVFTYIVQLSRTSLVNCRSNLQERLARSLLMLHDRIDSDRIDLTHGLLATMLGARRPGVTAAMQMLEYRGLISAKRGSFEIRDRAELINLSHGAYGEEEQASIQPATREPRATRACQPGRLRIPPRRKSPPA
ncbi:Crp/Fnr family transcriptional regulator [Mesorhizobium australicum]|uniref:Crp/Fnr family transcriptional regulator n=1 Tax=Mesorhizobium australicum TaxID=536018 RepID=UPI003336C46F